MQVILRTKGLRIDLTEYVDRPIAQIKSVGDVFGSATIVIPFINPADIEQIDLSDKIAEMSIVEITDIEDTRQYYVVQSDVEKKNDIEYKHTLQLKSVELLFTFRPISDFSVRQPVEEGQVFVNQIKGSVGSETYYTAGSNNIYYNYLEIEINPSVRQITNDDTIIENKQLKVAGKYRVHFKGLLETIRQWGAEVHITTVTNAKIDIEVSGVVVSSVELGTLEYAWFANQLNEQITITRSFEINNAGEIKLYLRGDLSPSRQSPRVTFSNVVYEIAYYYTEQANINYLDEVVEKVLRLTSVNISEFILDSNTKSRLAMIKAFDDMQTDITLYDALNRVANYVKAKVRLTLDFKKNEKIVWFEFYDDLSDVEFVEVENDQVNILSSVNELTSAFELKNNNILKSNFVREVVTLRSSGVSQITTENISIQLTYAIDRLRSVVMYGKVYYAKNGDVINPSSKVDLTEMIVLKDYYNTLSDLTSYDNRDIDTKNNHLSFQRGGKSIDDLAYTGNMNETWLSNDKGIRALYETGATALSRQFGVEIDEEKMNGERIDRGKLDDDAVYIIVEYMTFGESNAVIQKDNQDKFEEKIIRKLNANERVNNADMLGSYARQKVNAIGGTQRAISGMTNNPEQIPKMGSKDDNYRVVSVTKYSGDEEVTFIATLVENYLYESEYVGIDSDRRLYRIPKDDYVDRVDKALNILYLDKEETVGNNTEFNLKGLVSILTTSAGSYVPPKIAYLSFDNKLVSQYIDINSLGNTVEFRLAMLDNYSAGYKKINTILNGQPFTYQRGVPYCDLFGRVNNVTVEYYAYLENTTINNLNEYPEGQTMGLGLMGTLAYPVRKDAGERIIISSQISFLSKHPDITIYDGLAKYNRQVLNETRDIKMTRLNYMPNKYDKFIDLGKTDGIWENVMEFKEYYMDFYASSKKPYAWFDNESKELLLVVDNVEIGYNKIYYSGKRYEIGEVDYSPLEIQRLKVGLKAEVDLRDEYIEIDDIKKKVYCYIHTLALS